MAPRIETVERSLSNILGQKAKEALGADQMIRKGGYGGEVGDKKHCSAKSDEK